MKLIYQEHQGLRHRYIAEYISHKIPIQ